MFLKKQLPWFIFFLFVFTAMFLHRGEHLFISQSDAPLGKMFLWLTFIGFVGYSYYCSTKENIFKTLKSIWPFFWSRQIIIDLYIGVSVSMAIIYLNEGSALTVALWFFPLVLFANQATLLYLAMNYDSLLSKFF